MLRIQYKYWQIRILGGYDKGWGGEPPHFLNVYTFRYALHKRSLKTTVRRPQKHFVEHSPPLEYWFIIV